MYIEYFDETAHELIRWSFEIIEIYPDYKISAIDITNLALIRVKY